VEKLAEKAVVENLNELETKHPSQRRKEENERLESALVAHGPATGKIRPKVGGRNYSNSQFNRVTESTRQPDSLFKPRTFWPR
jgi:membrane carboxypeptidase/penicillin-binding protein